MPSIAGRRQMRVPGVRFPDLRVQALLAACCSLALRPAGFTSRDLRHLLPPAGKRSRGHVRRPDQLRGDLWEVLRNTIASARARPRQVDEAVSDDESHRERNYKRSHRRKQNIHAGVGHQESE